MVLRHHISSKNKAVLNYIKKCLRDPVKFCKNILNLDLTMYQKKFMEDRSKRIVSRQCRQTGKSTIAAARALWVALSGNKQLVLIIAPSRDQATLIFNKCKDLLYQSILFPMMPELLVRETQTILKFSNEYGGGEIVSKTCGIDGRKLKGYSPNLLIYDEMALIPEVVFGEVSPSLSATDGDMIGLSTPKRKVGRFYNWCSGNVFSEHYVDLYECPFHRRDKEKPDMTYNCDEKSDDFKDIYNDIVVDDLSAMTEATFQQEYHALFIDDVSSYFPISLLKSIPLSSSPSEKPREDRRYFLSVDPARSGADECVYMVLETNMKITHGRIVYIEKEAKSKLNGILKRMDELDDYWNFTMKYVDSTTLGKGIEDFSYLVNMKNPELLDEEDEDYEEMQNVEWVDTSLQSKSLMYTNLKVYMEKKTIQIPTDDKYFLNQLNSMDHKWSANNFLIIHAPTGSRDDYCDALALVCRAFSQNRDRLVVYDTRGIDMFS